MTREPLTREQRDALRENVARGDRSSNLLAADDCPLDLLACPAAGRHGLVYMQGELAEGDALTPDEARRLAGALVALADHAEHGPGEWRNGEWEPDPRVPALNQTREGEETT